jgi:protein-S-isoprenylcysteine O-methyltransferase Ste14
LQRQRMRLFPALSLSILNGWLLLGAYFLGLTLNVLTFPREKRRKLFLEPSHPKGDRRSVVLLLGRLAAISFVASMIFTPLQTGSPFVYVGLAIYLLGFSVVMLSLFEYRRAEADRPVLQGIYAVTRNPQWIGLVLVFAGTAVAVATWLQLGLLAVVVVAYHFQILLEERTCLGLYGKPYQAYMKRVPRYLGF